MATEYSKPAAGRRAFLRSPSASDWTQPETGAVRQGHPTQSRISARRHTLGMTGARRKEIRERVMTRLKSWDCFSVLAIHIDPPAADKVPSALHQELTSVLKATEQKHKALRFHWTGPLYGLAAPGVETDTAVILARQIQTELARTRVETVTIGVAAFPLLTFNRSQILLNACKALDHAAFFGPGSVMAFDAVSLNISGDQRYQDGDYGAAIAEYRTALRLDPTNVNVLNSLGVCLAKRSDLAAAKASFKGALAAEPREVMALYNMGLVCLQEASPVQALDWFKKAHRLDSKTFEISFQIGKLLSEAQQWKKALPYLETAFESKGTRGSLHCLLGECYRGLNQTAKAIAAYKKAVKLNPNDASALSALGLLYHQKGENPDICLTFCRQSVRIAPQNGLYRKRLADLYHQYGQLEPALAEYQRAAALGQDCNQKIEAVREGVAATQKRKQCCA